MIDFDNIPKKTREKDIGKIVADYLRYWHLFAIGVVVCIAFAFLYLRYHVTPEYGIRGKILLNNKVGGEELSGAESMGNLGLVKQSRNIQDEIGVLQSFDLMKITLDELVMEVAYYMEGRFSEVEVYQKDLPFYIVLQDSVALQQYGTLGHLLVIDDSKFQLEGKDANGRSQKMTHYFGEEISTPFGKFSLELNSEKPFNKLQKPILIKFKNLQKLASEYNQKLKANPVDKNGEGLLEIYLTDAIPRRGVDVLNKLIEVYARKSVEHQNTLASSTLELIDGRLGLLTGELSGVEKDVESYKQSNNLTDVSSDAERFVQLAGEADRALASIRADLDALNTLENNLEQSTTESFFVISSFSIQNPILLGLITQHNELQQNRKSLLRTTQAGNPLVIEIDKQLFDLRSTLLANVRSIKLGLVKSERSLLNNAKKYKSKISRVPTAERALLEINRDQGIKQNIYLYLLQKREEEALSINAPFSDMRVIEKPRAGNVAVSPQKMPIYSGAMLLGLFVPFLLVFFKHKLSTKIQSVDDIAGLTDVLVLGSVAQSTEKEVIVVAENNVTPIAEMFRLLRFNLKFVSNEKENQVIMITSSKRGEGKTFVTINLGVSLALTGKKVALLDFDLRAPKLISDIGVSSPTAGITDYIVNPKLKASDLVVPVQSQENLVCIGAGSTAPNPGELMLSGRIENLFDDLKKSFDYILIDTAPIGKVADAFSLSPYVDTTLYIVRQDFSNKTELKILDEISVSKKLNPIMVVFNDMKMEKYNSYGYGTDLRKP